MNLLLVAMLGGLWAAILLTGVPGRRPRSPLASVDSFERYMDTLAPLQQMPSPDDEDAAWRPSPPSPPSPPPRAVVLRRRRQVVRALLAAVPGGLALALLFGSWAWVLPVLAVTALAVYCALLVHIRQRAERRTQVIRSLQDRPAGATALSVREAEVRHAGGG